jgi:hypothetical protein
LKIGVRARFLFLGALLGAATAVAEDERVIHPSAADSARGTAMALLRHLAAGKIEEAAALSNAPQQRLEVLRQYRTAIGEEEFKRVFGRYFAPQNRVIAEVAIARHRLLIWDLGEAGNQLAGQYYVEVDGRFLLDDEPSPERSKLQQVLERYRREK